MKMMSDGDGELLSRVCADPRLMPEMERGSNVKSPGTKAGHRWMGRLRCPVRRLGRLALTRRGWPGARPQMVAGFAGRRGRPEKLGGARWRRGGAFVRWLAEERV